MRFVASFVLVLGFLMSFAKGDDAKENKRKPKFTIGKETTYVTGPVNADDYIDYAAALNERMSKGIKPADNANVLLLKAIGPSRTATLPPEFFKRLGMEALPERGDYFIDLMNFLGEHLKIRSVERQRALIHQLEEVIWNRTWTRKEYPEIAAWLLANEKPLALVIEATKRPHFFTPLLPVKAKEGPKGLTWTPLPVTWRSYALARALAARALLHVAEGRSDAAWPDLLACHRLGRLIARGSFLVEAEIGMNIDSDAGNADLAYLNGTKLSAKQLQVCLRDLQGLPALPDIAEKMDLGERLVLLDYVMMVVRTGVLNLRKLDDFSRSNNPDPWDWKLSQPIDWDSTLRTANQWYDRMAAAMRIKDRGTREKQLQQLKEERWEVEFDLREEGVRPRIWQAKDAKVRGKVVGNAMICVRLRELHSGPFRKDRAEQLASNLRIAFALAWYQSEHRRFPKTLAELGPKYLATIPGDLFSGKPLIYRPAENGYLLYSVGQNGKDDQGQGHKDDPWGDDFAVRMPLPKLPPKE